MFAPVQDLGGISTLFSNTITRVMGFSVFAALFQRGEPSSGYLWDTFRMFILGSLMEGGRRFFEWLVERVRFQYCITAQFTEGDPACDWIILYMTEENVWKRSRDFRITAKSSARRWAINFGQGGKGRPGNENVEFVPTYELPHLFRWRGFWIETRRNTGVMAQPPFGGFTPSAISLTIYTLDVSVLQSFIEEARLRYLELGRTSVILHSASQPNFGPGFVWNSVKRKLRRPLDSIILEEGMMESILKDAREFIEMEDWYIEAGIPHRRGYLLHGPPGTGKTSTIHALAGELGLEIFSLSLSAGFVDDAFLQQAASSIPKKAIFLIEDIDCAFPSRDDDQTTASAGCASSSGYLGLPLMGQMRHSSVTLSGLLNVIDGIGSEEGVLFFATTNYIERLDPALLRPGRIDRRVQYNLTTTDQAAALFSRFFPPSRTLLKPSASSPQKTISEEERSTLLRELAISFAKYTPKNEFTTAELQGYLLSCKESPEKAVAGIQAWVRQEMDDRRERRVKARHRLTERINSTRPEDGNSIGLMEVGTPPSTASDGKPEAILTPPSTPPLRKRGGISLVVASYEQVPLSQTGPDGEHSVIVL